MKQIIFSLLIIAFFGSCQRKESAFIGKDLHNGDLIFQTSQSAQSQAIQLATKSKYSHCGIVYKEDGKWFVFEAYNLYSAHRLTSGLPVAKTAIM